MQPIGPKRPGSPPMFTVESKDQSTGAVGRVDAVKPGSAHSYTTQMAPSGRGAPVAAPLFRRPIVDPSKFPPPGSTSGSVGAGRDVEALSPSPNNQQDQKLD